MSVAERLRPTTATRRCAGLGAATVAWLALYEVNLPLWDWLVYDVVGLAPASRLGSGVHFFFYDSIKIALLLVGIIFLVTEHCPGALDAHERAQHGDQEDDPDQQQRDLDGVIEEEVHP